MIGWIHNLIGAILPNSVGQGAQTFEKKARAKLIDVTDAASLNEEARRKSLELLSMTPKGSVKVDRFPFSSSTRIRKKVKKNITPFYDTAEIMDEITERVVEAAKEDPFYKKLFG